MMRNRLDRSRFALLLGLAIDNIGSGLFLPLGILYSTRAVGLDVALAGTLVAVGSLVGFAVPPVAGRMTHRLGPRSVVVTSQAVQACGALTYLLATGPVSVLAAAALMSAGTQLFYCSVFVLVADVSTSEAKERPFALVGMVRAAAFGLGTLIAALALTQDSVAVLRWLVAVDGATFVVAALVLWLLVDVERVSHDSPPTGTLTVLRDRSYRMLMGATCLSALAIDVALIGMPVYVVDVLSGPTWMPGALLALGTGLSSVLGVTVVDALRGRRRTSSLQLGAGLYAGWAALMTGMLIVPAPLLLPYAVATWLVLVLANKIFYPLAGALSEALPPRAGRAGYMATYQYSFTAAQVLAPAVVALFALSGWLPWVAVAVAAVASWALFGRLGRAMPVETDRPLVTVPG